VIKEYGPIMTKNSDRVDSTHKEYGELIYPVFVNVMVLFQKIERACRKGGLTASNQVQDRKSCSMATTEQQRCRAPRVFSWRMRCLIVIGAEKGE
jgi:hypothetical protein